MIRRLPRGSALPAGTPARYRTNDGYVLLRWRVGKGEYVEVLEHRVVSGRVVDSDHVHHRNHVKTDNSPENLEPLSVSAHGHAHAVIDRRAVAAAYLSGESTIKVAQRFGTHAGNVSRMLAQRGVPIRPMPKRRPDIDRGAALARIRAGEPIARIARDMHCAHSTIDAIRIEHSLPPRRGGRP